ncbi:hypothetical protein Hena1_02460 [Erwinia phage Hena1]|uniref:AP2/ERF domain-containing protein n=1 Tax=Erwinia phage Hena1 TaxID=2678601 RepID=A0A6B9JBG6_9CAUD|nr:HNH endonuclease [Erwinia phage Hena1]QGZ16396.1 hypothetical protein Hena1_02460 [Erwinia phage Hena1]
MKTKVCDVGINDSPRPTSWRVEGVLFHHPAYVSWHNMINRCYSGRYKNYVGVTVCEEWKYFMGFHKWWTTNHVEGWVLDKDLRGKGSKVYSPETCIYIPLWLNSHIIKRKGKHSQGVTYDKRLGKYKAQRVKADPRGRYIGYFKTEEAAREAWLADVDREALPDLEGLDISIQELFLKWKLSQDQQDI